MENNLADLFKNQKLSLVKVISQDSDLTTFRLIDRNIAEIPHLQVRQTSHNQVDTKDLILRNLIRGLQQEIGRLMKVENVLVQELNLTTKEK